MQRRSFIAGSLAASLAAPAIGRAASASTLRFVPDADLATLDPVWTTSYQSRDHAFMVLRHAVRPGRGLPSDGADAGRLRRRE